jgi:hypothetical protein
LDVGVPGPKDSYEWRVYSAEQSIGIGQRLRSDLADIGHA